MGDDIVYSPNKYRETEGIQVRRIGYALDEATLQQVAYNHGIDISIRKMTQAQKSQIRYLAIMEQSGNVMGDMARTIITPANSIRILSQQVTLLSRAIGNMLIPMLTKLLPYLVAVIKYATAAANRLAVLWGFKIPEIDYGDGLSAGEEATEDLTGGFNDVTDATEEATKALQKYLAPFDEINKPSSSVDSKSDSKDDNSFSNDLNIQLPEYDFLKGFKEQVEATFGDMFDVFKQAWAEKGQAVMDAAKRALNEIKELCKSVGRSFSEIWNDGTGLKLMNTLLGLSERIFLIIGDIAQAFRKAWDEGGRGTLLVKTLFSMCTELLRVVNNIADSFRVAWNSGMEQEIFARLIELATTLLSIIGNFAAAFNVAWTSNNLGTSLLQSIASLCEHILYFANNIAQAFLSVWTNGTGVTLFTQILTIIKTIVDTADLIVMKFNAAWMESDRGKQIIQTLADAFSNVLTFIQLVCDSAKEFWSVMGSSFAESVMNGIKALADGLEHLTQKFVEVWQNGGDQFFQSLGKLIGKIIELAGVIVGQLVSSLGDSLAPILSTLMDVLANVFDAVSQFIDWLLTDGRPVLDAIVEVVKNILLAWMGWKAITAVLSPLLAPIKGLFGIVSKVMGVFGKFIPVLEFFGITGSSIIGIVAKIGGGFTSAFGAIGSAFSTLGSLILAHPIVAIIVAIAGALIYLWNTNEDFRNAVIEIWNGIVGIVQDAWGGICALFSGDTEGFVEHAKNLFNRLPGPIKDALTTTGTVVSETWGGFCAMLAGDTDGMKTHVQNVFNALPEPVRNAIIGLGTWLLEKWNEIVTNVRNFGQSLSDGWNWIWTSISTFCQNIWLSITTAWNNMWLYLSTVCPNIWLTITTIWNNIWITLSTICQNIWTWITTTWNNIWTTISTVCQNIWNWVVTTWNNIWTTISTVCQNIWNWIVTVWNNICATIVSICQNIWNWISNIWNNICTTVTSICQNIWNWLSNIWNNILNTITSICDNIKSWISEKWEWLKNNIISAVENARDSVIGAFENIYNSVTSKVKSLVDSVIGWWNDLRENLSKPIEAVVNTIRNTFSGDDSGVGNAGNTGGSNGSVASQGGKSQSAFNKLKGYATGGFPATGQLFYARENGIPEMVGSIGGKTAVANNNQIEDAIAVAVYKAVMSAMQSSGGGGSNQPTQITINVGEETLVNKIIKGINDESRRQGQVLINV